MPNLKKLYVMRVLWWKYPWQIAFQFFILFVHFAKDFYAQWLKMRGSPLKFKCISVGTLSFSFLHFRAEIPKAFCGSGQSRCFNSWSPNGGRSGKITVRWPHFCWKRNHWSGQHDKLKRAGSYTAARPLLIFRRIQCAPNHGSNHCNLPWCGSLPQL